MVKNTPDNIVSFSKKTFNSNLEKLFCAAMKAVDPFQFVTFVTKL